MPLSQIVLRQDDTSGEAKEVLRLVLQLTEAWESQEREDASVLDDKLADYVFFPLSRVLAKQERYPVRVLESIVILLRRLIDYGWKAKLSAELAMQLLIFLALTAEGASSYETRREFPEEMILEAYRCMSALLAAASLSPVSWVGEHTAKAVGHGIGAALEGAEHGASSQIQLEALTCLSILFFTVGSREALATFLPGTVSSLSKMLSPPSRLRLQRKVLIKGLDSLRLSLVTVLRDINTRGLLSKTQKDGRRSEDELTKETSNKDGEQTVLTAAWLTATSAQIKIALASVLKLRRHEVVDVRKALYRFCVCLLDECHHSLANCQSILVETAMMVEDEDMTQSRLETGLQDLASIYPELGDCIKTTLYGWITGLPRIMQGSDEGTKQQAVRNLLRGSKLVTELQLDSTTLDEALGDALRGSLVAVVRGSKPSRLVAEGAVTDALWSGTGTSAGDASSDTPMQGCSPILLAHEGERSTREELISLLDGIGSSRLQLKLAAEMISYVRDTDGPEQLAAYWLSFELLKALYRRSSDLDSLVDLSSSSESQQQQMIFQELYNFSASTLASYPGVSDGDWRLEAVALEMTAFAASQLKSDFRPELIDVLYPMTTFLGAQRPQLRNHAFAALNSMAASCGYNSVSDLIVDNADYMVNSVSLRLNTFDIAPASVKVLTMLIRLTGPRLVPYLDDAIDAVFAALDNYHGYAAFVESLFAVLSEVVEQGVKSDRLVADSGASAVQDHKKKPPGSTSMDDILSVLLEHDRKAARDGDDLEPHPRRPWGPAKQKPTTFLETLEEMEGRDKEAESEQEPAPSDVEKAEVRKSPTYTLLTRVANLTQHYLTSPTPTLRKSLLDVIATVSPALAPDEDTFLPVVNAIWPVVMARMHDMEPYVVIAACRALSALCAAAGDFLSTRFKTAWGEDLGKWFGRARSEARSMMKHTGGFPARMGSSQGNTGNILIAGRRPNDASSAAESEPLQLVRIDAAVAAPVQAQPPWTKGLVHADVGLGRFAQPAQIWDAAVDLAAALVRHVRIDDVMFDEILALVADELPARDPGVREALETVNADAVWLALCRRGLVPCPRAPERVALHGVMMEFPPMGQVG